MKCLCGFYAGVHKYVFFEVLETQVMLILLHTVDNEVDFIVHLLLFLFSFWTCKYSAMHLVSVAYLHTLLFSYHVFIM